MGYAIANQASAMGAEVVLISGPTADLKVQPGVKKFDVVTGEEMFHTVLEHFDDCDTVICCAAVADFKPAIEARHKIKNKTSSFSLDLSPTRDIVAHLGQIKKDQFLVGFALETQEALANAKSKLEKKNLDLIVLNSLEDKGVAFGSDSNKVTLIDRDGTITPFDLKAKEFVAKDLVDYLINVNDA